jgi:hypothetical protein
MSGDNKRPSRTGDLYGHTEMAQGRRRVTVMLALGKDTVTRLSWKLHLKQPLDQLRAPGNRCALHDHDHGIHDEFHEQPDP